MTLKSELVLFLSPTSLKGISRTVKSSGLMRCFWAVSFFLGCSCAMYQSFQLFHTYYEYPINTVILEKELFDVFSDNSINKGIFGVTICNLEPFDVKGVQRFTKKHNVSQTPSEYTKTVLDMFQCENRQCSGLNEQDKKTMETLLTLMAYIENIGLDKAAALGVQLNDFLVKCEVLVIDFGTTIGFPCELNKSVLFIDSEYLNCYTLPTPSNIPKGFVVYGFKFTVYLDSFLYPKRPSFMQTPYRQVGLLVNIHQPETIPRKFKNKVMIRPGTSSSVVVIPRIRKRLPHPYGNCLDCPEQIGKKYLKCKTAKTYNHMKCRAMMMMRNMKQECNCSVPTWYVPMNISHKPSCRLISGGYDMLLTNGKCIEDNVELFVRGIQCPLPCFELEYDISTSHAHGRMEYHSSSIKISLLVIDLNTCFNPTRR